MLGKMEGKRRREWQRMRWLDSFTDSMDMNLSNLQETVKDTEAWHAAVHGVTKIRHNLAIKPQHQILAIVSLETQTVPIMIWEVFQPRRLWILLSYIYHWAFLYLLIWQRVPDSWRNFLLQTRNQPLLQGTLVPCSGKILCESLNLSSKPSF